jgi:hypothetical protein
VLGFLVLIRSTGRGSPENLIDDVANANHGYALLNLLTSALICGWIWSFVFASIRGQSRRRLGEGGCIRSYFFATFYWAEG